MVLTYSSILELTANLSINKLEKSVLLVAYRTI